MTLTLLAFDNSPEAFTFEQEVKRCQGHITGWRYLLSKSPALCEFTAHVPEQPELITLTPPKP